MPEIKLKPCPFCGRKPKITDLGQVKILSCEYSKCMIQSRICYTWRQEKEAIEAWNKRACDTKELHAYWIPSEYGCKCSMCKKEFLAEDAAKLYECPNCKSQMGEPRKEADDA